MKKSMDDVSSDNLQRHLQVSRSSCIMSDTSPSKMHSKLFQEYTTTWPSPKVSFRERTVEVEEALMKPTSTLSKMMVDWNKTRQFKAESQQVTLTSPFVKLAALIPSLGGGLVASTVNDYNYSTA